MNPGKMRTFGMQDMRYREEQECNREHFGDFSYNLLIHTVQIRKAGLFPLRDDSTGWQ